jgi:hypothetical protein
MIEITRVEEIEGGGAIVTIDMTEEGKMFLLNAGFNAIMRKALEDKRTQDLVDGLNDYWTKDTDTSGREEK